jgi:hypothetical protein
MLVVSRARETWRLFSRLDCVLFPHYRMKGSTQVFSRELEVKSDFAITSN